MGKNRGYENVSLELSLIERLDRAVKEGRGKSRADIARRAIGEYLARGKQNAMDVRGRRIVTLCGSVRFKEDFASWNEKLTLDGLIVLAPGCFDHEWLHCPENNGELKKDGLDELHRDKIAISDFIFVINRGAYMGTSTRNEIEYARKLGKPVQFMEPDRDRNFEADEPELGAGDPTIGEEDTDG